MIKTGDFILATGYAYFEKCKVTSVAEGVAVLENGVKLNSTSYQPLNSKYKFMAFDEDLYEALTAQSLIAKGLTELTDLVHAYRTDLDKVVYIHKKLTKCINSIKKYGQE